MDIGKCCRIPIPTEDPEKMDEVKLSELRIVLFGRIAVGKSTLGDIILGDTKTFTSKDTTRVRTEKCQVGKQIINGENVTVVDTPGLFKMGKSEEELVKEIKQSIELCKPGPHVFLLVERLGEITPDESKTLEVFKRTFGKYAMAYAMVVFTHHDDDPPAEEAKTEEGMNKCMLKDFIEPCHGRHFFFDIKNKSPTQVTELLNMITKMRKEYCYIPKMLEEAEKETKQEQQEKNPKPEERRDRTAFFEKIGLMGIIVGCALGYFIGSSELTPTSGALLGAVAGMILSMGTTALGMKAKMLIDKCCKK